MYRRSILNIWRSLKSFSALTRPAWLERSASSDSSESVSTDREQLASRPGLSSRTGKEVLVLHSQELLPEEPAGAHHLSQGLKHAGRFEVLQLRRPVRSGEKLGRQKVELSQRLTRIGRCGQQVSELLDERGGGPDLFESTLGLDLRA